RTLPASPLEERDPPLRIEILQLPGFLPVDPVHRGQLARQLLVQVVEEAGPHEEEDARRKGPDDGRQHRGMPERQARAHAEGGEPHSCASPSMNPTPRRVCRSFFSKGSSILRRSRATVTSITLSSGVARAVTCHTSRASISRDTTRPRWRSRYSRSSNSFTVSSSGSPALVTRRVMTSMVRSSNCSL